MRATRSKPAELTFLLLVGTALGGCQTDRVTFDTLASQPGWHLVRQVDGLPSAAAVRESPAPGPTWVYIEGDGHAWLSRTLPSRDPTPRDPIGLRLALAPQEASVIYLGRPCQFVYTHDGCPVASWTTERYSAATVAALDHMLDRALSGTSPGGIILVGYSGGGVIATLLAARRKDVRGLITVAANLDVAMWTTHHGVTPLAGSLDPANEASALAHVPQVHFVGGKDMVVPPSVVEAFVAKLPPGTPVHLHIEPGFDHRCCWSLEWSRLRDVAFGALHVQTPVNSSQR